MELRAGEGHCPEELTSRQPPRSLLSFHSGETKAQRREDLSVPISGDPAVHAGDVGSEDLRADMGGKELRSGEQGWKEGWLCAVHPYR